LVFALAIPFWLIGAMAGRGLPLPMNLPLSALQAFCPLVAALILVYREDGLGGAKRLLKRIFDYKKIEPKIWYVPIISLLPFIYLMSYGVMRLMGLPLPDEPQIPYLTIPILLVVFFTAAASEEVGWMGYAVESNAGPMERTDDQHYLGAGVLLKGPRERVGWLTATAWEVNPGESLKAEMRAKDGREAKKG